MSSISKLMKQAARMQQQMEHVQTRLASRTVEFVINLESPLP